MGWVSSPCFNWASSKAIWYLGRPFWVKGCGRLRGQRSIYLELGAACGDRVQFLKNRLFRSFWIRFLGYLHAQIWKFPKVVVPQISKSLDHDRDQSPASTLHPWVLPRLSSMTPAASASWMNLSYGSHGKFSIVK